MSDVISQIVEKQKEKDAEVGSGAGDSELLFVGAKGAGKSTLIHSFLLKEDPQKPTTALEYRFARRSTGTNNASTVCNIWELGGGTQLSELIKVVLLPDRMHACVVAITLDLGAPGEALPTLQFWLEHVRKHAGSRGVSPMDRCLQKRRGPQPGRSRARPQTVERVGRHHQRERQPAKDAPEPLHGAISSIQRRTMSSPSSSTVDLPSSGMATPGSGLAMR